VQDVRAAADGPRLFVTGASGFLGRSLTRDAAAAGWDVVAPPSSRCDVRDAVAVLDAVRACRPAAVAHLAYRRDEADTIVDGSRNVARAAVAAGARLVHVSTDVVFGGRPEPYREDDEAAPTIDYGRHKLAAERAVAGVAPAAVIVRTSLLYGDERDTGPSEQLVRDACTGRHDVAFFVDEFRCPAHVADVAAAVLALAERPDVRGPLHVAGPRPMSRLAFAQLLAARLGEDPDRLRSSSVAASGLVRPANVVLDSSWAAAMGITVRDPLTSPP
jgi:dTDP-4-dehydrorhamnose reductase